MACVDLVHRMLDSFELQLQWLVSPAIVFEYLPLRDIGVEHCTPLEEDFAFFCLFVLQVDLEFFRHQREPFIHFLFGVEHEFEAVSILVGQLLVIVQLDQLSAVDCLSRNVPV
jgi:hypothetical protein